MDVTCTINKDDVNLHHNSPLNKQQNNNNNNNLHNNVYLPKSIPDKAAPIDGPYPGDPEFTEVKDFWKFKQNNNDLCYVKRVLPKFFCEQ